MTKSELRRRLRARREGVSPELRRTWSQKTSDHIWKSGRLEGAEVVAGYASFGAEADPTALLRYHHQRGRLLAFPRVTAEGLVWHLADPDALVSVPPWHIREPVVGRDPVVAADEIDAWIVPGLGFTRAGDRLGYGKGYYDRALQGCGERIGFAFELQVVDAMPAAAHDVRMTVLATERGLTACVRP